MNWSTIRPFANSQNDAFEELVCQVARKENITGAKRFVRKGKPDAGVECFWILENGNEWAWQAKFFTQSLSNVQWGQIDDSVRNALDRHPKLTVYTVAIPNDPPDARVAGQSSMTKKWDRHVKKWAEWADKKGMSVEFKSWWSSDLIERLQKPENTGLTYFWFHKDEFADQWCEEQNELSITELGNRYTPELNIELEVSKCFDAVGQNKRFQAKTSEIFDHFVTNSKKIVQRIDLAERPVTELYRTIEDFVSLFLGCNLECPNKIPFNDFDQFLEKLNGQIKEEMDYSHLCIDKGDTSASDETSKIHQQRISRLSELSMFADNLKTFLVSDFARLSNKPFLLLEGEAGIGKSHLLADVVRRRNEHGERSIFLLGQHFVTDEDPWTQIFKRLHVSCSVDEFLGSLSAKAQLAGSRFIIFIDAINEGRGRYFWDKNIKSFVQKIAQYEWLGLVLSVRSSYKSLILSEVGDVGEYFIERVHSGFRDVEDEATRIFFENYGIELPSVPLLHPEFQNPLFLKLLCEGLRNAGLIKIPPGFQGISLIMDFFINSVNGRLARPDRFDYSTSINLAKKTVVALIKDKIGRGFQYVPYEEAFILGEKILSEVSTKKNLLGELISEGLLTKNLFWDGNQNEEGVYITYERFEDHLTVDYLISETKDIETAFLPDGNLYFLAKDENTIYMRKGLVEALSIQLPEKIGKELYEFLGEVSTSYPVAESFVQSLLWRKTETITESLLTYVNKTVFKYQGTHDLFWDTILSLACEPGNFFNANGLHRNLIDLSMADRDSWWSAYISDRYSDDFVVKRLIDWGWTSESKAHISDESAFLAAIALAWFHTSSNRKLRDSSTKALIGLLEKRPAVLLQLLEKFEAVNDPYVSERLFAVSYGCVVRNQSRDKLSEIAHHTYRTIFKTKDEVFPHILLRDYARGIIEFATGQGIELAFDINECRPPYKSSFPTNPLSNDQIDEKYFFNYQGAAFKDVYWSQNAILRSMTTEYGRGIGRYGDFGRYVFQSAFRSWDVNVDELSNIAVEWIFEKYGYDVKKHGEFDRTIRPRGRGVHYKERIGKKYQWIAMYELLARVADNFSKHDRWLSQGADEPYAGPWNPYVRDIDPTMLIKKDHRDDDDNFPNEWWSVMEYSNWNLDDLAWIQTSEDLPNLNKFLCVMDDNQSEWLILDGYPSWSEPKKFGDEKWDYPYKRLWCHIRSFLIHTEEVEQFIGWLNSDRSRFHRLPFADQPYEIFSREFYWAPAYQDLFREECTGNSWTKITSGEGSKYVASIKDTAKIFLWEEEYDFSKESTVSFLKPSLDIFDGLGLRFATREGEMINDKGDAVCFDPSVYKKSSNFLLLKKNALTPFLEKNDIALVWAIIGEKNWIDGLSRGKDYPGRLEFEGVYTLADGLIRGELHAAHSPD